MTRFQKVAEIIDTTVHCLWLGIFVVFFAYLTWLGFSDGWPKIFPIGCIVIALILLIIICYAIYKTYEWLHDPNAVSIW